MPLKYFLCPDGQQIEVSECLNKGCRMAWCLPAKRCLSVRTLRAVADQRPWKGIPSTTQLLKGVREAFLEITTDYCEDPMKALYRVHGTEGHGKLDKYIEFWESGEERLFDDINSGQYDFYDPVTKQLWDNKFCGSFKIRKALGLMSVDVPTGQFYKNGKPKTRKEYVEGGRKDRLDWAIQMNDYRIKLESQGYEVNQMVIECIARDGGIRGAQQEGIPIVINRISDHWIRRYLKTKADRLLKALETGETPPLCSNRERWRGRKCQDWCNVRETCKLRTEMEWRKLNVNITAVY